MDFFSSLFLKRSSTAKSHRGSLFVIPFVDDLDYLQTISDRIYLEEAGYWGLVALREREKEYAIGNVNNEKYFG